jgi:hypothetical protein
MINDLWFKTNLSRSGKEMASSPCDKKLHREKKKKKEVTKRQALSWTLFQRMKIGEGRPMKDFQITFS